MHNWIFQPIVIVEEKKVVLGFILERHL